MGLFSAFGISDDSLLKQPLQSRASQKLANEALVTRQVEKKLLFPTIATGSIPTAPASDPFEQVADYYRFGKFAVGLEDVYDVLPRTFDDPAEDQKPASIRVFGQRPKDNVAKDLLPAYTKFFIEGVQEAHVERSQIVETFGNFYVFMFGERPPVYSFSGKLVNSKNANWVSDLMFMYETYLRGTRCVEQNARLILTYGGRQIEGLMLNVNTATQAAIEGAVEFSFQVVVFQRKFLGFSADFGFATSDNKNLKADEQFLKMLNQVTGGRTGAGSSAPGVSAAQNAVRLTMLGSPAVGLLTA
jgi:hypothetical protein